MKDIAVDTKNEYLYITDGYKIMCYDLQGNVIKKNASIADCEYLRFINGELTVLSVYFGQKDGDGFFNRTVLYRMNRDLQTTDSVEVKKVFMERISGTLNPRMDYITSGDSGTYLYYPVLTAEPGLRDTLYRLTDRNLIPDLKLKFAGEGVTDGNRKTIALLNIYKSSRFVFAYYQQKGGAYHFCYDSRTGRGFNMKDGFSDDVHNTGKADIRPLNVNSEMFYYLHTADEYISEEPNPVLYIGILKN
jgi:hypothetical protein